MNIKIYLLGRFRVDVEGRPAEEGLCGRAQELLAYLVLYKERQHRREALAEQLWGDELVPGRKSLRQALWRLHSTLGDEAADALLGSTNDWLYARTDSGLWVDLDELEKGYGAIEDVACDELSESDVKRMRRVADLYQGELLEGLEPAWCEMPRERARHMYKALLLKLMGHSLASGQHQCGIRYGMRLLDADPASERAHRRLMRLYEESGDRAAALRQYARCGRAMHEELGVSPEAKTVELFLRLRRDQLGIPQTSGERGVDSAEQLGEVLHLLEELQATLSDARQRVYQEIQKAEKVLATIH